MKRVSCAKVLELVVDVIESLGAELRDGTVVGDGAQQGADRLAQFVDLGARLLDVGDAVDGAGAVLDRLVEVRHALLEILELFGEFLDRRGGAGRIFGARKAPRQHEERGNQRRAAAANGERAKMTGNDFIMACLPRHGFPKGGRGGILAQVGRLAYRKKRLASRLPN